MIVVGMIRCKYSILWVGDRMKKLFLISILCLGLFVADHVKAYNVVGIGDSITTGYGVKEEEKYLSIFCKQLEEQQPTTCHNMAIDGLTSTQLLEKLSDSSFQTELKKADYILMSIGGNDYLQEFTNNLPTYLIKQDHYPNIATIQTVLLANMKQIYEQLHMLNTTAKIGVVPLYNPYSRHLEHNAVLIQEYNQVKDAYVALATAQKQVVISPDLSSVLEDKAYSNVDTQDRALDPHPNALGHNMIAKQLIAAMDVRPVMNEVKKPKPQEQLLYIGISLGVLIIGLIWWKKRT